MTRRDKAIARSITHAILQPEQKRRALTQRVSAYFYLFWLPFENVQQESFNTLQSTWGVSDDAYRKSFGAEEDAAKSLKSMGEQGYSGSTFFVTTDAAYLVKSIPRHFEHSFFKHDLLLPYADYMQRNPKSLLCRITGFLESSQWSLGSILGLAPAHHIVMENILFGQGEDGTEWKHWDLKPLSYFFPERDIADGALTSEATKNKLTDEFHESISLNLDQAEDFKGQLEKDTAFLAKSNAVDYSLFLVRMPYSEAADPTSSEGVNTVTPAGAPFVPPEPPSWRTGVKSADGKYVYRAAILDFFWAKHTVHAKAMTGLINAYNLFDRKGPMSVTTDSSEYRQRFLQMCTNFLEVVPDGVAQAE